MLTLSGRPMSMLSRISCSKKIRPQAGRSSQGSGVFRECLFLS
jgi:hypothetical protein